MPDYALTGVANVKMNCDEIVTGSDTVYTQRAKVAIGADGTVGDVSSANPLPVVVQTALAPTTHSVASPMDSSRLMDSLTALTPKFAVISTAGAADATLVAAVTSKKIRVLSLFLTCTSQALRFESGTGGTALTGVMAGQTSINLAFNPLGHFETAAGALLNLEQGGSLASMGWLTYVEV